jgi:hypothetical protein
MDHDLKELITEVLRAGSGILDGTIGGVSA